MIAGPSGTQGKDGVKKSKSIPVLMGYHTVPKKSPATLSHNLLAFQEKPLTSRNSEEKIDHEEEHAEKKPQKRRSLAKLFTSMVKSHQNWIYMLFASIGIPIFIIFLYFFEVRINVSIQRARTTPLDQVFSQFVICIQS